MFKSIAIYSSLFLLFGIFYGYFYQKTELATFLIVPRSSELRVLAPSRLIPEDLIESFQAENGSTVVIEYISDKNDIESFDKFDIMVVRHTRVPLLKQNESIRKIQKDLIRNYDNLSADFKGLPSDPDCEYSIPILWGIKKAYSISKPNNILTPPPIDMASLVTNPIGKVFRVTSPKSVFQDVKQDMDLWIQSFVVTSKARNNKAAHLFIDYFLQRDIAVELSRLTMSSGTNKALETASVDNSLKPSFLREQKISQITRIRVQ